MTDASQSGPMLAADGTPLKQSLAKSLRRQKMRALLLIAPLLLFVIFSFVLPIATMLFRSVENSIVVDTIPLTVEALQDWDDSTGELPEPPVALHPEPKGGDHSARDHSSQWYALDLGVETNDLPHGELIGE